MSSDSKRFAHGIVTRRTGSEGPRHDPYSYTEYHVKGKIGSRDIDVRYHEGLGEWVELYGTKMQLSTRCSRLAFETEVGVSIRALERALDRVAPCCHKPRIESMSGFPGETLYICSTCDKIVGGSFNESAII